MANIFSFILGLASILFHCVNVSIFIFPFPRFRSFGSAAPMKLSEAKLLSFPLALLSSLPVILLGSFGPTGSHEEFDNELSHKPLDGPRIMIPAIILQIPFCIPYI
jgi:hypothetical protein